MALGASPAPRHVSQLVQSRWRMELILPEGQELPEYRPGLSLAGQLRSPHCLAGTVPGSAGATANRTDETPQGAPTASWGTGEQLVS